jgi:hypothetical protein
MEITSTRRAASAKVQGLDVGVWGILLQHNLGILYHLDTDHIARSIVDRKTNAQPMDEG